MLTVDEVQKCALGENDIFPILKEDLEPFRAARDLARRLGKEMLRVGALIALENLCSGKMLGDSGDIILNTYPFGRMTRKRCPDFIGVCSGSRRLYGVFNAIERQLNSYQWPNHDYIDWKTMAKSITVFTDKWDPKYLKMYESLFINAILKYNVYFNFYLVTPYGVSRIPFMNRQQVDKIKRSFEGEDVLGTLSELIAQYGISEANLRISSILSSYHERERNYRFDFKDLVYVFSNTTGEKKTGKMNEILAKRFLSTAIELNNAGVLKQEKHSLDGVWYYLDMGIFKLEWIDMEAGDDPYVSKMHNALQKLLDSLV